MQRVSTKRKSPQRIGAGELPRLSNPNIAAVWIDSVNVNVRGDSIVQLRFFGSTPESLNEVSRVVTSFDFFKKMAAKFAEVVANEEKAAADTK